MCFPVDRSQLTCFGFGRLGLPAQLTDRASGPHFVNWYLLLIKACELLANVVFSLSSFSSSKGRKAFGWATTHRCWHTTRNANAPPHLYAQLAVLVMLKVNLLQKALPHMRIASAPAPTTLPTQVCPILSSYKLSCATTSLLQLPASSAFQIISLGLSFG